MLIIKCHALSQLTFVNQFQNITKSDIKMIESLCYKFLWNSGPDRVKRSTLKLPKAEGGIDGIDVESFLLAVKSRQYFKAEDSNDTLKFIQRYCPMSEDISCIVRTELSKVLKKCWKNIENIDLTNKDRSALWNCSLRMFLKPGSKADQTLSNVDAFNLLDAIDNGRSVVNKVIRFLPRIFRQILCNNCLPSTESVPIIIGNKVKPSKKLTSRELQSVFKTNLNKVKPFFISGKHNMQVINDKDEKLSWFYLWKIRNPSLRNVRLKVLYKDVYCQERRNRFGLADSPFCEICNSVEDVQHQLFDCKNSKRMWQLYEKIFGCSVSFKEVVLIKSSIPAEIVKSTILKLLIQIDRSAHLSIHHIILRIIHSLDLELKVTNNPVYQDIISKLAAMT